MARNDCKKLSTTKDLDIKERLRAALAISKLLRLYGAYAEHHGFDNAIMEAGIHALDCEIEAVLNLLDRKSAKPQNGAKRSLRSTAEMSGQAL